MMHIDTIEHAAKTIISRYAYAHYCKVRKRILHM